MFSNEFFVRRAHGAIHFRAVTSGNPDGEFLQRDAHEVGCYGLRGGWALHAKTLKPVFAPEVTQQDGPFICEECSTDAIHRRCTERIDHFAHHARLSPVIRREESDLHRACKNEICEALAAQFPNGNWKTEREIPEKKKDKLSKLTPDISGRVNSVPIAIEIQASYLTLNRIIKRALGYTARGISILWIVPLTEDLGELPFRPRLYERYLHAMYFGRTYYWVSGYGATVLPVNYAPTFRHIESHSFYKEGEEQLVDGYDKLYKIIKKPNPSRRLDIANDFISRRRPEFRPHNERKFIPITLLWRDKLKAWWDPKLVERYKHEYPEDDHTSE